MDGALNKVGLYDFFGVFLAGILFIVILLSLDLPLFFSLEPTNNAVINVILFILEAYFLGIILQEISSCFDKYIFDIQRNARRTFLKDKNRIAENTMELEISRKFANEILKISEIEHFYTESENEYVFFHMKAFLETHGKIEPVDRINSLYAMSRSLTLALLFCFIFYFVNIKIPSAKTYAVLIALFAVIFLFLRRTIRLSRYKVRKIIRLYISMKQ